MSVPVVIGTNPTRAEWLADCLATIPKDRQVLIHWPGGYEIAALRTGCRSFDRFLFLHDSVEVLDPAFWDIIDAVEGPAWLTGGPPMFLGIHERHLLQPILDTYPDEVDKETTIRLEVDLPRRVPYSRIWPEVTDHTALGVEHRHGRDNLAVGNRYFVKWKGTHR